MPRLASSTKTPKGHKTVARAQSNALGSASNDLPSPEGSEHGELPTELGLEAEWPLVRLGDLFEIQQGKALNAKARSEGKLAPFLRTANVFWGHLDLADLDEMPFSEGEARRLALVPGDLLTCEGGDVGRTAIWRGEVAPCFHQNHVHRLRTKRSDVEPEFYMRWMDAAIRQLGFYGGTSNKTTIPNLSKNRLAAFVVPHPPLPEQRMITVVLVTVQMAKEACDRVIAATRQLKQSLLHHLFTYSPVPFREAEQVELQDTEYGPVPMAWKVVELKDAVAEIDYGLSAPIPKMQPKGGVKIVSTADITKDGRVLYSQIRRVEAPNRTIARLTLRTGDILFNWRNSPGLIGKTAIFEASADPHIFASFILRIRTDEERSHNVFLKHLLNHYREKGVFLLLARRAVNQANYNRNEISVLKIPLPPYDVQVEVAQLIAGVDAKLAAEEARRTALDNLFKSLLHHLMTGKVRVEGFG